MLLCTQYLDEADQLADRIAVIDHGRVIAEGTPGQLKASVGQGALHVRLLDPEQRAAAELVLSRTLDALVHLESDPAALSVAAADAERASDAVAALFEAGIDVANFSLGQPTLDEVFLALTGQPAPTRTRRWPHERRSHPRRGRAAARAVGPRRARLVRAPAAPERAGQLPSPSAGAGCSRSSTCPSSCST